MNDLNKDELLHRSTIKAVDSEFSITSREASNGHPPSDISQK